MNKKLSFIASLFFIAILHFFSTSSVDAATCSSSNIRFASSSNTIYVTGPVDCTLSNIKSIRPTVPLTLVNADSKVWLLKANLKLEQGARLDLHGDSIGGDVNELRLRSNNNTSSTSTIWVRAHWGTIDIANTKIKSWNEAAGEPDTEYASFKRSYIHVRSFLDGSIPRESRMDIKNSDVGYLGYNAAESYGLAWKVLGIIPSVFEAVNVYGNVENSRIHHNYFGMYTFGAYGMNIVANEVDNNIQYGIDPHDDSDSLVIEGNNSHHNGNHGIICSQRCDHLTIRNNISRNNKGNGIMLHRNTNETLVENNELFDNYDSGIAIFDSHNNTIRNNTSLRNNHGIRFSVGSSGNRVEQNEFGDSTLHGIYFYKGSDAPTSGDGRPKQNTFISNNLHDNDDYVVKLKEGDGNTFEDNSFIGNQREIYLYDANNNTFKNNIFTGANNFYYARFKADNSVVDTDSFSVKLGDSASRMQLINSLNAVLQNSKNIPTTAGQSSSIIPLSQSLSGGSNIVLFNKINLNVVPLEGQINIITNIWRTSPPISRKWTETASVSTISANHTVGDLALDTPYDVFVNGILFNTYTSNDTGVISFLYNGGYDAPKVFEVIEGSLAAVEATPTEEASNSGELEGI